MHIIKERKSSGATFFLGDINTGTWPSMLGESRIGTIKYGLEFCGTQTRAGLFWRGPAAIETLQIRPVIREGATK
jgi:hypothetical protein